MTELKKYCSAQVYESGRWGSFHPHGCAKKITVERDGKPYCTIHDPERVKAKHAKQNERLSLISVEYQAKRAVQKAEAEVVQAVRSASHTIGLSIIRERMIDADIELAKATKALADFDQKG